MAENRKLDMSLEDIIRMDGIKGPRFGRGMNRTGGSGNFAGNRRRGGGGGGGGGGQMGGDRRRGPYDGQPKRLQSNGGLYSRSRNQSSYGGGGGQSRSYGGGDRQSSFGGGRRQMNGGGGGNRRQGTLHVSNLATSVNTEDIEELFSTFGVLVRSYVHYDQFGTSLGTAEIIFEQRSDAVDARNKLNSVPLDGKPLRIVMFDEDDGPNDPFSNYLRSSQQQQARSNNRGYNNNNSNNNYQNRDHRGGNRNGGGGGGRNDGGGRNQRSEGRSGRNGPQKSADDLDREMDEWRMQVDGGDTNIDGLEDELGI